MYTKQQSFIRWPLVNIIHPSEMQKKISNVPYDVKSNTLHCDCLIVLEASSSKTAIFPFKIRYYGDDIFDLEGIDAHGDVKLVLDGHLIDQYANQNDIVGYYSAITREIKHHYNDAFLCDKLHFGLYASGGMRNKVNLVKQNTFYDQLKIAFKNDYILDHEIYLHSAKTMTTEEEGRFAWLTLKELYNQTSHTVIDMGGATLQIAREKYFVGSNFGKDNIINALIENKVLWCDNDHMQYNGPICRDKISNMLSAFNFSGVNHDYNREIYLISAFYKYFVTLCGVYLPYISDRHYNVEEHQDLVSKCAEFYEDEIISMNIMLYQKMTDEACAYWNSDWDIEEQRYIYAKDICFLGNYIHVILSKLGINEKQELYVANVDWELGAAYEILGVLLEK